MIDYHRARSSAENFSVERMQALIASTEELLDDIRHQKGPAIAELRSRATATLREARGHLELLQPAAADLQGRVLRSTLKFIRRDPWRAVAVASLIALAIGVLSLSGGDDADD